MTLLEKLVCFIQQYAARGVDIVGVDPLEVEGPDEATGDFARLFRWLRDAADQDEQGGLPDRAMRRLRARRAFCDLGGVDWERAFPREWAFSCYEQELLSTGLDRRVWVADSAGFSGRLEGIRPGWCFITPGAHGLVGTPEDRFLQRTTSVVKVSSVIVCAGSGVERTEASEVSSLAEVQRIRDEIATVQGYYRPKKAQPESEQAASRESEVA